jgi:hypothetical protein
MKKANNSPSKKTFGIRKVGKAVKRLNKHKSIKPYKGQGK